MITIDPIKVKEACASLIAYVDTSLSDNPLFLNEGLVPIEMMAVLSPEIQSLFMPFVGKRPVLLQQQLNTWMSAPEEAMALHILSVNKDNVSMIEIPSPGLVQLHVNIDSFDVDDFQQLLRTLENKSISSLCFSGNLSISQAIFARFLESLGPIPLLHMTEPAWAAYMLHQAMYRHTLVTQLAIKPSTSTSTTIWKPLLSQWLALEPSPHHTISHVKACGPTITSERMHLINASILGLGPLFFEKLIEQANTLFPETTLNPITLDLNAHDYHDDTLKALAEAFKKHNPPFAKLRLSVNQALISGPGFAELIKALHHSSIQQLELVFSEDDVQSLAIPELLSHLIPTAPCLITVCQEGETTPLFDQPFQGFYSTILPQIQHRNAERLWSSHARTAPAETLTDLAIPTETQPSFAKAIKLKALTQGNQVEHHIRLEVQHVEMETHEQVVQQELEIIEMGVHQQHQDYQGELVDFDAFQQSPYIEKIQAGRYALDTAELLGFVRHEWFGNLPEAIKFLTPEAATELAHHLDTFATLNKENLPPYFILKKTDKHEFVLDYDPLSEEPKINPYTPIASPRFNTEPLLPIVLDEARVRHLIGHEALFNALCFKGTPPHYDATPLTNLWINYGDEGLRRFFEPMQRLEILHPGLPLFLYNHYLQYFPQWDHFISSSHFLTALESLSGFNELQLTWLKAFLTSTGPSRHDFQHTLEAFQLFWHQLDTECQKQQVNLGSIEPKWITGKGHPVVYMERLATILSHSRNLEEQLQSLEEVNLDGYGAYYASKYEGFKVVSTEMGFVYNPDIEKERQFNPEHHVYCTSLETLSSLLDNSQSWERKVQENSGKAWFINDTREIIPLQEIEALKNSGAAVPCILLTRNTESSFRQRKPSSAYHRYIEVAQGYIKKISVEKTSDDVFYTLLFRIIGQQSAGIRIKDYAAEVQKEKQRYFSRMYLQNIFFSSLFYVMHERYQKTPLTDLFRSLYEITGAYTWTLLEIINESLMQIYSLDIRLNELEGLVISNHLLGMNSLEFECSGIDKELSVHKFFSVLKENKYAALKMLDIFHTKLGSKWPMIYAIDTAEFLATNPVISAFYHDDLLVFSTLINTKRAEVYHQKVTNPTILENLQNVQSYLLKAATTASPNNWHYAITCMIQSKAPFDYQRFIAVMAAIDALPEFNHTAVDGLLRTCGFKITASLPDVFKHDNHRVKTSLIQLLMLLHRLQRPDARLMDLAAPVTAEEAIAMQRERDDLFKLNLSELQQQLNEAWHHSGVLFQVIGKKVIQSLLTDIKEGLIEQLFSTLPSTPFITTLVPKISLIKDFVDDDDFEKINRISMQAASLSNQLSTLISDDRFSRDSTQVTTLFSTVNFSTLSYDILFSLLDLLLTMKQRGYCTLLSEIIKKNGFENTLDMMDLFRAIRQAHSRELPTAYIERIIQLFPVGTHRRHFELLMNDIGSIFEKNQDDLILKFLMTTKHCSLEKLSILARLTAKMTTHRESVYKFLHTLGERQQLDAVFEQLHLHPHAPRLLEIMAKSFVMTPQKNVTARQIDVRQLAQILSALTPEETQQLHAFFETTTVSIDCLYHGLTNRDPNQPFEDFLHAFEKAPFGSRDFSLQFDTSEVTRVVNDARDLANGTRFPFQYRKQMMEAFFFVNRIGHDLPVYAQKAAKDLSNAEIQRLFLEIKQGALDHLDPFQRRLYALGLMREAMYRSTGLFPNSTQMIALIDCMMHEGDVISNIDTGQGKSLIDTLKATLLWLESDRVDVSTSSLTDARRDIAIFSTFFKTLGIPYSNAPLSSSSPFGDYQTNGVNFSTFAQLSLFFSRAKATGVPLGNEADRVSLVMNESDYSALDDRTIYRFASSAGASVGVGNEWIYYAINEFVTQPRFKQCNTSEDQDINALRDFLKGKAKLVSKSSRLISQFDDEQLLTWIESAIIVHYSLRENKAYVVTKEPERRLINGVPCLTHVAKILMKDGRINPDSQFGNGMQQLLHAKLNTDRRRESPGAPDAFIIAPETKTLISTNNANLIHDYRSKHGYIWGSSGSVGSPLEMEEQYRKFGFEFSSIPPHQKNRVRVGQPCILANETDQFSAIIKQITASRKKQAQMTDLVFFKDIDTATRFFDFLNSQPGNKLRSQLYLGQGDEEHVIATAAESGMITVTTSALGRNTDIPYNPTIGMSVYQTYMDSARGTRQKSGRTGRQGSAGATFLILNQEDLSKTDLAAIQSEIDTKTAEERLFNEALFNVLDYLFHCIDKTIKDAAIKTEILKTSWPQYSAHLEATYHQLKRSGHYETEAFIKASIGLFNQTFGCDVPAEPVEPAIASLRERHPPATPYDAHDRPVVPADCIPADIIAYQLLHVNPENTNVDTTILTQKLTALFVDNTLSDQDYFIYLNSTDLSLATIRQEHQRFIDQWLKENLSSSRSKGALSRLLGFKDPLKTIANHRHYLLLFRALTTHQGETPLVTLDTLKPAISTLLDEYLKTSWFINTQRKEACRQLKDAINIAETIEGLLEVLATNKIDIIHHDIDTNQHSFWRRFKRLNFFGESRLQTSLDAALALSSALTGTAVPASLAAGLTTELRGVVTHPEHLDPLTPSPASLDTFSKTVASVAVKDKGNAKLLKKGIETYLTKELDTKPTPGMTGRKPRGGG